MCAQGLVAKATAAASYVTEGGHLCRKAGAQLSDLQLALCCPLSYFINSLSFSRTLRAICHPYPPQQAQEEKELPLLKVLCLPSHLLAKSSKIAERVRERLGIVPRQIYL